MAKQKSQSALEHYRAACPEEQEVMAFMVVVVQNAYLQDIRNTLISLLSHAKTIRRIAVWAFLIYMLPVIFVCGLVIAMFFTGLGSTILGGSP